MTNDESQMTNETPSPNLVPLSFRQCFPFFGFLPPWSVRDASTPLDVNQTHSRTNDPRTPNGKRRAEEGTAFRGSGTVETGDCRFTRG